MIDMLAVVSVFSSHFGVFKGIFRGGNSCFADSIFLSSTQVRVCVWTMADMTLGALQYTIQYNPYKTAEFAHTQVA